MRFTIFRNELIHFELEVVRNIVKPKENMKNKFDQKKIIFLINVENV